MSVITPKQTPYVAHLEEVSSVAFLEQISENFIDSTTGQF